MSYHIIENELKLKYPILAITRVQREQMLPLVGKRSCVYQCIEQFAQGKTILTAGALSCPGSNVGCGFVDGFPNIPGGFGHFIASGRGEGFPKGERIKCCPELAEKMLLAQPQNVMESYNAIEIEPYQEDLSPELVLFFVTPDQLSGLLTLYYYRSESMDSVMVPLCSGCAQLFRLPFGELRKEEPKAVIGNTDFFSRPHLDKELLSFVLPFERFQQMCADASESCFFSPAWNGVKKRL